ncbi:hypothetical protein [Sinorhizobium fredii]|uniref:hypothetical protein n=1 Tax=Rhizobium fredii TaxID=380 RepID=UPI00295848D3|nr:hypothetical protein [Sinorhizobium fredii]WOS66578.1 hypothetical protein SFGR64A_23210 [Sinorhizobium fredii GR64]
MTTPVPERFGNVDETRVDPQVPDFEFLDKIGQVGCVESDLHLPLWNAIPRQHWISDKGAAAARAWGCK